MVDLHRFRQGNVGQRGGEMEPCAQKNSRGPGKSRGSARLPCPGTWAGERRAGGQGWEGQDGSHHCRASKGGKKMHILGSLQKEKKRKKHPEGTSGVGEAALFVPGFVTVNLNFKKFANQG